MVAAYRRGTFGTGVVRGNGLALQQSGVVSNGTVVIPGDTNFASNVLLTKTNSINASTNTTFLDSSSNALTITRVGVPTQGSVTPYWPSGYWSGYFNGSTDYLNYAAQTPFVFGTGDFTIEFWLYSPVSGAGGIYPGYIDWRGSNSATPAPVVYNNNGSLVFFTAGADRITTTFTWANTWVHVAVVRISGTTKMYANGVQVGSSYTDSNNYTVGTGAPYIGQNGVGGGFFTGYMSNIRVVKGVGVYTGTFTPPTSPLSSTQSAGTNIAAITGTATSLLTCQDNRFKDNSTNTFTAIVSGTTQVQVFQPFTLPAAYSTSTYGGSAYNAAIGGNRLDVAGTSGFFGSGVSYTMECWFNSTTTSPSGIDNTNLVATNTNTYPTRWIWDVNVQSTTIQLRIVTESNAVLFNSSAVAYSLGQWAHLAVVNNATTNTLTFYINGVSVGSRAAVSLTSYSTLNLIGTYVANPGYYSNFRIVNGVAVYSGNFTPPTAPLTTAGSTSAASYPSTTNVNTSFSSTQTAVLLNFANAGIYDSTAQTDIITTGTAQVSTTQFKWSPTSMKFNGTSDYLTTPSNPSLALRTGDFTVEFWMYPTAAQTGDIVDTRVSGDSANSWCVQLDATNIHFTGVGSNYLSYPYTINTWTHVAYTRVSGSVSVYINGTKYGSSVTLTNDFTGTVYRIGATFNNFYYAGYIQDLRVTKGLARYTANFTAPTTTFSNGPTTYTPSVPDAPIIANITTITNTSVKIGYMAPLLNGGSTITSYTAVSTPGGFTGTSVTSRSGTITVSGLGYANTYTFAVYATNAIGTSTYSASTKSITTPLSLGRIFILSDMDLAMTDLVMLNTSIAGSSKAKSYALATIYGSD
jgi:hypothetical protein